MCFARTCKANKDHVESHLDIRKTTIQDILFKELSRYHGLDSYLERLNPRCELIYDDQAWCFESDQTLDIIQTDLLTICNSVNLFPAIKTRICSDIARPDCPFNTYVQIQSKPLISKQNAETNAKILLNFDALYDLGIILDALERALPKYAFDLISLSIECYDTIGIRNILCPSGYLWQGFLSVSLASLAIVDYFFQ